MGDLHDAGSGEHVVAVGVLTGLGGQQHQQRTEPLAPGGQQVPRRLGDVGGAPLHVTVEQLLDRLHAGAQPGRERVVGDRQGQRCGGRGGAHLMNCPASAASSSSGPGTTPRTSVPRTATAMVPLVSHEGTATAAGSVPSATSEKNITWMVRT